MPSPRSRGRWRPKQEIKPVCGAKLKHGEGICRRPAGWGTVHVGQGSCKYHGGSVANHRKRAIINDAIQFMGAPKEINPLDAIIWCIQITAGEVEWLTLKIGEIDEEQWIEHTPLGKQMHVLQRTRADAQDRLVRYSRDAIQLGLAERAIRMAEQFGLTIARLLENVAADLKLNASQQHQWPRIVKRHLMLLEANMPVSDDDRLEVLEMTNGKTHAKRPAA
jgi:hypothetical protein